MLEWKVQLIPERILTTEQTIQITEHATNFFGGRERCYAEVEHIRGKEYEISIKIR